MGTKMFKVVGAMLLMGLTTGSVFAGGQSNTLEAENAKLRAQLNQQRQEAMRAEAIQAAMQAGMEDAETRTSYAEGAKPVAGFTKNAFLQSADGKFKLAFAGQLQFKYVFNMRDGQPNDGAGDNNIENGFEFRRVGLYFKGHVGDPTIKYMLKTKVSGKAIQLDTLFIDWEAMDGLTISPYYYNSLLVRQQQISSKRQIAPDRPMLMDVFGTPTAPGLQVKYDAIDMVHVGANWYSADGNDFEKSATDIALTLRADVKVMGDSWKPWGDMVAWSDEKLNVFVGGGVDIQHGKNGGGGTEDWMKVTGTIDGSFKMNGIGVYGAFFVQNQTMNNNRSYCDLGAQLTGSYTIKDTWAPYMQVAAYIPSSNGQSANTAYVTSNGVAAISLGCNYFIRKHNAKLTVDLTFCTESMPFKAAGTGLLEDVKGKSGQVALSAQFQLLF